MKKILILIFSFACCINKLAAQQPVKKFFDSRDTTYGFYSIIEPKSKMPVAVLVLLDGYGGNAENFLTETKIDEAAFENNILTVCIPTGMRLYADSLIISLLNKTISEVLTAYKIPKTKLVMGGFSSGGTILLRYAELCNQNPGNYPAVPRMLFTGDSPIDLAGLYRSSKRELQKNFTGWWLDEARMIIDRLYKKAGDPATNKKAWQTINPFNAADTTAGNEKYLAGIAYRTYHDVDVQWQMENRSRSLYQANALDASELISRLRLRGHKEADFIQSKIPGQRSDGRRHPHSWNIIDADELIKWIFKIMK
jgi:pimeloyl-ACP methyl ester carboxylesterase